MMHSSSILFVTSWAAFLTAALVGIARWFHPAIFSSSLTTILLSIGVVAAVGVLWRRPL
ncbi:MAG: hypothetical protein HYZ61_00255 [Candidatus Andersenbacteria bacterium]|nr:hypothetical protein [Candidatus Andersenbacteria bacterium]